MEARPVGCWRPTCGGRPLWRRRPRRVWSRGPPQLKVGFATRCAAGPQSRSRLGGGGGRDVCGVVAPLS
eukprot:861872-Prorocentrum_lima.AAC.1